MKTRVLYLLSIKSYLHFITAFCKLLNGLNEDFKDFLGIWCSKITNKYIINKVNVTALEWNVYVFKTDIHLWVEKFPSGQMIWSIVHCLLLQSWTWGNNDNRNCRIWTVWNGSLDVWVFCSPWFLTQVEVS